MIIGVLQLELSIGDAMSLKDKRRVIKSLKDRIAHGHNVSIAEVGALDAHRRAILGIAMVANDRGYVEGALSKLVDFVRTVHSLDLVDYQIDLLGRKAQRHRDAEAQRSQIAFLCVSASP